MLSLCYLEDLDDLLCPASIRQRNLRAHKYGWLSERLLAPALSAASPSNSKLPIDRACQNKSASISDDDETQKPLAQFNAKQFDDMTVFWLRMGPDKLASVFPTVCIGGTAPEGS